MDLGGGGVVSNVVYGTFLMILTFLILTNYKGLTAIMKQGGSTVTQVSKTLQGR
jgi:hypothetical protein